MESRWNITRECDGRIVAGVIAPNQSAALLGVGWGYSGARYEPDVAGRPAMVAAGVIYRAEPEPR